MEEFKKIKGVQRKEAVGMNDLMRLFIRYNNLSASLNTQRVFDAWDAVSGIKDQTIGRFYKDGTLFISVSSSMLRTHLDMQKDAMVKAINDHLAQDSLFDSEYAPVGFVKKLVLK